jgi:hypothetical protein
LAAYLAVRQTLGYGMRAEQTLLADFVRFVSQRGELNPIPGTSRLRVGPTARTIVAREDPRHG